MTGTIIVVIVPCVAPRQIWDKWLEKTPGDATEITGAELLPADAEQKDTYEPVEKEAPRPGPQGWKQLRWHRSDGTSRRFNGGDLMVTV